MKTCIICRHKKDLSAFSDEHVIPDALGGYYHIYSVCKECNNKLGTNIDIKLTDHIFSKYMRNNLGLKSQNRKIPNPFEGTHVLENHNNQKVRLELDGKGIPIPYILPNVIVEKNDSKTHIQISMDGADKNKFEKILHKILKRNKIDVDINNISYDLNNHIKEFQPIIKMEQSIDMKDFKIGLLKIAYEFAVDKITQYFDDPKAIEISKVLASADYEKAESFVAGSGFEKNMIDPLKDFFDLESNKHYLILLGGHNGLLCYIKLSKLFEIIVFLSDKSYIQDNIIFGINDLDTKKFTSGDFISEIQNIRSPIEYSFEYFFDTYEEAEEFQKLQQKPEYDLYTENNKIPLFDKNNNKVYEHVDQKIDQMLMNNKVEYYGDGIVENNCIAPLDEKLYMKILPTKQLIQVNIIKARDKLIKKL